MGSSFTLWGFEVREWNIAWRREYRSSGNSSLDSVAVAWSRQLIKPLHLNPFCTGLSKGHKKLTLYFISTPCDQWWPMLNSMKIHTLLNSCNDSHPRYNNVKLQMIVVPFFACGSDSGKAFLQIRSCLIILFNGRAFMSEFTVILHSLLICNWILPPFLFITKYVHVCLLTLIFIRATIAWRSLKQQFT